MDDFAAEAVTKLKADLREIGPMSDELRQIMDDFITQITELNGLIAAERRNEEGYFRAANTTADH